MALMLGLARSSMAVSPMEAERLDTLAVLASEPTGARLRLPLAAGAGLLAFESTFLRRFFRSGATDFALLLLWSVFPITFAWTVVRSRPQPAAQP